MPSIYDDLFEDDGKASKPTEGQPEPIDFDDSIFRETGKESLDEILSLIKEFTIKAEPFSQLLSRTRAVDYEIEKGVLDFFLVSYNNHDQGSLANERSYYSVLQNKFEAIMIPMRDLAQLHLQTIKQFNRDIDSDYYSVEKTDHQISSEKEMAIDHINTQRKILADAENSLSILEEAMDYTENRIKKYINIGGINNISSSEYEILVQKRITLTSGQQHQFDYSFFTMNLLDKTAIAMGMYLKETTSQYLSKLNLIFKK